MKYEQIIFLQGHEAGSLLELIKSDGEESAFEHLKQWHYPGEHQVSHTQIGSMDSRLHHDGYVMYYSVLFEYIGLECEIEDEDE